jgi:hypothetical protein
MKVQRQQGISPTQPVTDRTKCMHTLGSADNTHNFPTVIT